MALKNKLIGDRNFYKTVLTVTIPIMLQNLITNFVSLLDNFMVGKLSGSEPMSAVSISNQILLIVNLALFGALSGIGIYGSQFYGKGNNDGIRYALRFKMYVSIAVTFVSIGILLFCRGDIINLFLHDENAESAQITFDLASQYILVMLTGLIPFGLAQVFATTLRETGDTRTPMIAGFAAVFTNVIFNYILIFGKFGAPALGVKGAAVATVISRFVEFAILVVYVIVKRNKFIYVKGLFKSFKVPKNLLGGFFAKGGSLMANEILWSGSMTALSIAYSLHGLEVVAGYGVSSTVINLFFISGMSLGVATGIIVGKQLGAGQHETAISSASKLMFFSFVSCIAMSVLLILIGGKIPDLYNISDEAKHYATYFICISAIFMPVDSICNSCYFTLRSGGKTFITVIFDAGSMWLVSVPVAFGLYYLAHLGIMYVYPIVVTMQLIKAIFGLLLIRSKIWVNTIV